MITTVVQILITTWLIFGTLEWFNRETAYYDQDRQGWLDIMLDTYPLVLVLIRTLYFLTTFLSILVIIFLVWSHPV